MLIFSDHVFFACKTQSLLEDLNIDSTIHK